MTGFIYAIGCRQYVKVGKAVDVKKRFSGIQTASPFDLRLLASGKFDDMDAAEDSLHSELDRWRVRGEWFELPICLRGRVCSIIKGGNTETLSEMMRYVQHTGMDRHMVKFQSEFESIAQNIRITEDPEAYGEIMLRAWLKACERS